MIEELITCYKSRIPVVWFVTHEESRAETAITEYMESIGGSAWIWSLTSSEDGFPGWEPPAGTDPEKESPFNKELAGSPEGAIRSVINFARDRQERVDNGEDLNYRTTAILRDPHIFLNENKLFIRTLRDATKELRDTTAFIVCISPIDKLPIDLQVDVEVIRPGLPNKETIRHLMEEHLDLYSISKDCLDELTEACTGLTLNQAADALGKSITQYNSIDLDFIRKIKTERISSVPGLTYIGEVPSMSNVGGLGGLKEWLKERKRGFSQEARDAGLPMPRGALFAGIPGSGKSLTAKAISSYFGMPLVCLSIPDLKAGIVGETESNINRAREAIEALDRVVVWADEFEKDLPKVGVRNVDGGTSDALLKGILTWLQERKGGSFVVATCNDISSLPPELLRKGRWDAIFFVDLPTAEEREEIFKIHLDLRKWELSDTDIKTLAQETEHHSGAEIEAACIDGRWKAFSQNRNLTVEDIQDCISLDVPLYETMKESIKELREWARKRARPASLKRKLTKKTRSKSFGNRKLLMNMEKADDGVKN